MINKTNTIKTYKLIPIQCGLIEIRLSEGSFKIATRENLNKHLVSLGFPEIDLNRLDAILNDSLISETPTEGTTIDEVLSLVTKGKYKRANK
jgi:hypothetical protein